MRSSILAFALLALSAGHASADDQIAASELAQKLANPVSPMTVLPFQMNYDRGYGPDDGKQFDMNVQPILPISINADWNLIARAIVPVVSQQDIAGPSGNQFGLGDTTLSLFLSPVDSGVPGLIWGLGPVLLLPTASDDLLGSEKWGAGPTGVIAEQMGPWTAGVMANHVWSSAGSDKRPDISATFVQPFLAYNTRDAWTFSLTSESTYDWKAGEWTIPIDFSIGKLVTVGKQPISIAAGPRFWATSPNGGPGGWGARLAVSFVFPTR